MNTRACGEATSTMRGTRGMEQWGGTQRRTKTAAETRTTTPKTTNLQP